MKMSQNDLLARCKKISFDHPCIKRSGLNCFSGDFSALGSSFHNLDGLGSYIFFDANKKMFFIDLAYYETVPPSHLLHRVLSISWSMKKQFFAFLHLDVHREVYPVVKEIEKIIFRKGADRLKKIIGGSGSPIEKIFNSYDTAKITAFYQSTGPILMGQLEELWSEMTVILQQLQLTDTMDFVGLCESVCNRDFLAQPLSSDQVFQLSPNLRLLVQFAVRLRLGSDKSEALQGLGKAG